MKVTFKSGAIGIEADLEVPPGCTRGAVICHPHPQYGGDMDNGVVCSIAGALGDAGYATLRFNFRGVGGSGGSYGGGVGEVDDARAAVHFITARAGVSRVTLAGYSFGAMVALQAGVWLEAVDALIAVAPPLSFSDVAFVASCEKPKLFIVGDRDQFCSRGEIEAQVASMTDPKALRLIKGADHFFSGQERAIAEAVRQWAQNGN